MAEQKEEQDIDKLPLKIITEAIGYFLSGIFALGYSLIHISENNEITLQIGNWTILFIGSILVIAGFVYLFYSICPIIRKIFDTIKKWVITFLFVMMSAEIIDRAFAFKDALPLLIITIIFGISLIIMIFVTSTSALKNVGQLLTMCLALTAIAIFQLFSSHNSGIRWDLLTTLIILAIFIFLAIIAYAKKRKIS